MTLNDIASALGISRATVSNAFNHPDRLADEMREKILAYCKAQGYYGPDPRARAMRRRDLHEVAVVFHHDLSYALTDPLSIAFLQGVAKELDKRKLALQLIPKMGRRVDWAAAFQTTADALIVHDEVDADLIPQLRALRKPLALVDAVVSDLNGVKIDDWQGAAQAMNYVLSKKPDFVVALCLPMDPIQRQSVMTQSPSADANFVGSARMSGYMHAITQSGFPLSRVSWIEVDDQDPDAAANLALPVIEPLLQQGRIGVAAMTDRMALSTLKALQERGASQLVALIGFDDIPAAEAAGLSTIRQNASLKGELAVQIALDAIGSVVLPVEIVIRST